MNGPTILVGNAGSNAPHLEAAEIRWFADSALIMMVCAGTLPTACRGECRGRLDFTPPVPIILPMPSHRPTERGPTYPMPFAYYDRLSARDSESIARAMRSRRSALPTRRQAGALRRRDRRSRCARTIGRRCKRDCQRLIDALATRLSRARSHGARPREAPRRRLWRVARPLRAGGRRHAGAHHGVDAHGAAPAGRRLSNLPAHARSTSSAITSTTNLFKLPETFHTEGFYKRESSLVNALLAQFGGTPVRRPHRRSPAPARSRLR